MNHLLLLNDALEYIEEHLGDELSQEEIARECCCSLSGLQKLFRYTFHISVGDYIGRRRMICSARELVETDRTVLDIALDYGYHSAEVFTRAFSRTWGEPPAVFRRNRRFTGLFPKLEINYDGGITMTDSRRKYDITELYDYLNSRRGTIILAFDIRGLIPINNISSKAGDKAIVESLRRIDEAAEEDMLLFRIGGDEFALATGLTDDAQADAVCKRVTDRNGEPFEYEGQQIPLSLFAARVRLGERSIRYNELFPEINDALDRAKGIL